jgi:hypothetical protein
VSLPSAGIRRRQHVTAALTACAALVLAMGGLLAINAMQNPVEVSVLAAGDVATPPAETAQIVGAERDENRETHDNDESDPSHAHADGERDTAHDDASGAAHAHDDGDTTHDDSGPHGHDGGDTTHDDSTPHDHGPTAPGAVPADHDDGHAHDPEPTVPGSPPVTHGDDHPHDPAPTVPGDTTPTTHGSDHPHDPAPTVPGDTTPTTLGTTHPHDGPNVQLAQLPADIQAQITAATNWAMQYDTTAKATAGGFRQITAYFPGLAAHYANLSRVLDQAAGFDPSVVDILLFNGTDENATLVGINYIVYSEGTPPEGFPGDYDVWHLHPALCLSGGIVVGEVEQGQTCPAGQTTFAFTDFWLLHVWSIPGWEAPEGIFAHANSRV